jgi:hypothetical protein
VTRYYLFSICIAVAAVANLPSLAVAQEEPPSQYEHVKGLEPFIGFWSGTMQPPDEAEQQLMVFCRWVANKSYAKFEIMSRNEDERMHMATIIVGRSAKEDGLRMWGFWPDRLATGKATVEENRLSYYATAQTLAGVSASADVTLEVDGDKLTINVTNSKRGDDEPPDFSVTLERQQRPDR